MACRRRLSARRTACCLRCSTPRFGTTDSQTNPAVGVQLPKLPKAQRRYLDHAQLAELAGGCGPYETLVLVLGYTGLRWGEVAALRVKRVDTMRGRLDVAEAMTEISGKVVFGHRRVTRRGRFLSRRSCVIGSQCRWPAKAGDDFVFTAPRWECSQSGTSAAAGLMPPPGQPVWTASSRMNYVTRRHRSRTRPAPA